jgi:hypothetical protein
MGKVPCTRILRCLQVYAHKDQCETEDPDYSCNTLPDTLHFNEIREIRQARTAASSLIRVPTEPIIHDHFRLSPDVVSNRVTSTGGVCSGQSERVRLGDLMPQPLKRTYALFIE